MTAVQLLPATADRGEWLKRRREGIGASEIAAVMGISPYDSPFSAWWRKHMGWEIDASPVMSTGTYLEPTIAAWFEEHGDPNENLLIRPAGLFANAERPWQLATPDRVLHLPCLDCDGRGFVGADPLAGCSCDDGTSDDFGPAGLLECKWVAYSWDGWGEDGSGNIPVHYRAQALWQLDVMEVADVFICALGPGGFRTYRIRRDEKDLTAMREAGRRFMESLAEGQPPDVDDHTATLPILRRLNDAIEDREVEIPESVAAGWLRAKRFKDLASRVEKRYSAMLRAHLGEAKTAVLGGKAFAARSIDDKLMRKS